MTILNKSVLKFQTSATNTGSVWEISDDSLLKKKATTWQSRHLTSGHPIDTKMYPTLQYILNKLCKKFKHLRLIVAENSETKVC